MLDFHSEYLLSLYCMVLLPDSIRFCVRNSVSSCSTISCNPLPSNGITHFLQYYWDLPTASNPYAFLLALSGIPLIHFGHFFYLSDTEIIDSPQLIQCFLCDMTDLRFRGAVYIPTKTTYTHIAFRYEQNVSTPVLLYFGAEMFSDPITSLSTLNTHYYQYTPKTHYQ